MRLSAANNEVPKNQENFSTSNVNPGHDVTLEE